ncbi:HEPN domain-containing protein [Leptospira kmetyi]|nr:HEPN domain-containing protein [Leptospira kmetyi]
MEQRIRGYYWLPGQSREKDGRPGILTIKNDGSHSLEVFGAFRESQHFESTKTVYGFSEKGKEISLLQVTDGGWEVSMPGFAISRYSGSYALIGGHFLDKSQFKVCAVRVRVPYLMEWHGNSGFSEKHENDKEGNLLKFTIEYSFPKTLKVQIDELQVSIAPVFRIKGDRINAAELNQETFLQVEVPTSRSFTEVYYPSVDNMLKFFSFAVGAPIRPDKILAYTESIESKYLVEVYVAFAIIMERSSKRIARQEMRFTFNHIGSIADQVLSAWLLNSQRILPAINQYFAGLHNDNLFLENEFLNITQALEVLHRTLYKGDFNFRERLIDLCNRSSIANTFLVQTEKFIEYLYNSRNYYTHYPEDLKEKALSGPDLFWLTQKARVLFEIHLMYELSFSESLVDQILRKNIHYNNIKIHSTI